MALNFRLGPLFPSGSVAGETDAIIPPRLAHRSLFSKVIYLLIYLSWLDHCVTQWYRNTHTRECALTHKYARVCVCVRARMCASASIFTAIYILYGLVNNRIRDGEGDYRKTQPKETFNLLWTKWWRWTKESAYIILCSILQWIHDLSLHQRYFRFSLFF